MKRVIEGTIGVWATPYDSLGPKEIREKSADLLLRQVNLCKHDMAPQWARIGTARVEITFDDDKEMVTSRVDSLRKEQQRTLAEAQRKATDLEREIQTLLAIEFDPEVQS